MTWRCVHIGPGGACLLALFCARAWRANRQRHGKRQRETGEGKSQGEGKKGKGRACQGEQHPAVACAAIPLHERTLSASELGYTPRKMGWERRKM
jgi:hypothetical protein